MTDFFEGISQREISIRGEPGKAPMFFRDVNMMLAIFTADRKAAASLLPSAKYRPLSFTPGRVLVGVNCFEYKDTDIGAYNEVAIPVAVRLGRRFTPGMFTVARSAMSEKYDAYIHDLPVSTEIAVAGGIDFLNYPKWLADIRFEEDEQSRSCRVLDPKTGDTRYAFTGKKIRTKTRPRICTFFSYPVMDGKIMKATVRVNMIEWGKKMFKSGFEIEEGTLSNLKPGKLLQYVYAPRCEAVLFDPEEVEPL
jgi:hypothetical protein